MSEERSDEFLSGRRGLPDKSSNAANPQGRVAGCPFGSPEKAKGELESGVVSEPTVQWVGNAWPRCRNP